MSETVSKNEVLRLENITMQFGGVVAINNFSMERLLIATTPPNCMVIFSSLRTWLLFAASLI